MAAPFAERLLAWFDREKRDLPWRRTTDPWAIWVSEVMLQQTRVEAVREPYSRFMRSFPTPAAFARATDDELLNAWRGLGYYRRARLLREGARQVVELHGGEVPSASDAFGRLSGVGEYTMGAVASIAFG
ncbi:MAG: A/G-specific adenine glycosylase, partial [Planctomycetes bacterium]|nr:A/G-specific adenine glycosylase [Planctomycetota bacterium]